ncbi:hypothetical protein [Paraburkholderia sediminicola]|uniref:hypothetical protein n=1 Tax=Paraburkholderia sediminicola TaxID=458836 RepID=UPI0038BD66A2
MDVPDGKHPLRVNRVQDGMTGIVEDRRGRMLPSHDVLTKEFGVSRTVLREALSIASPRERDEHLASKVLFLCHAGRCPCVYAGTWLPSFIDGASLKDRAHFP